MTGLLVLYAPTSAAADTAATALAGGTVWGISASLALRSGRYLVVRCGLSDVPRMVSGVAALAGWEIRCYGARIAAASIVDDPTQLMAYVCGRLDQAGQA